MNSRLLDRSDLETEEEESVEPPLETKKGEFLMIMIINISVWMEAVWERRQQMIHQLLSNTFFSPSKSLFLRILSLLISTTITDRSLGLWVEGHVDSRFLMEPKIVFEAKVS